MKITGHVHLDRSVLSTVVPAIVWDYADEIVNLGSYDTQGNSGGVAASFTVHARNTGGSAVTYELMGGGGLPQGLSLNPLTGVISGMGQASGGYTTYGFTIIAHSGELSSSKTFNITVFNSAGGQQGN